MKKNRLPVDVSRCCISSNTIEKQLRHVAIVAKFLDLNKPRSCNYAGKTEALKCMTFLCLTAQKTVFHTILPSLANANALLFVEIQKFCYHGNLTLHFSTPYLPLVVPVQWLLGFTWFDATDIMRGAGHYLVNQGGGLGLNDTKRC